MRQIPSCWILALLGLAAIGATAEDLPPIVQEVEVEAPVGDVWRAMTTKEGMESWMVAHAEIDLRIGGSMRTHYDPAGTLGDAKTIVNTVLAFDPERMFAIQVAQAPAGFPFPKAVERMWTVLYFDAIDARRTRVRCVGLGFADDEESRTMRHFFETGNRTTLEGLRKKFEPAAKADSGKAEGPEAVFNACRDALLEGKVEEVFARYSKGKQEREGGLEGFRASFAQRREEIVPLFRGAKVTFVAMEGVMASGVVLWGNGERWPPVSFVREDGVWKIDR